ncbi:MAG: MinD/ParA family protein [Deltaproteobacteria bacterium]|nr:MAG: MinD/ParA family protein [Deltaproteobacteria bacterium]
MDAIKATVVFDGNQYDVAAISAAGLQIECAEGFADETIRKLRGGSFKFVLRDIATGNEAELIGELARYEHDESLQGAHGGGRIVRIWIDYPDTLKGASGRRKKEETWSRPVRRNGGPGTGEGPGEAISPEVARGRAGRTIAVGGGKGGVGKTLFAVNLSLALSRMEKKITLLDGDIGNCNCNTLLGITRVESSLEDYLRKARSLEEVTVATAYPGLRLICGAQNKVDAFLTTEMSRLLTDIRQIDADCLMIDLGAGMSDETLDLYRIADDKIIVVTPQVTSLQNAYGFIKSAFFHDLKRTGGFAAFLDKVGSDPQKLHSLIGGLEEGHAARQALVVVLSRQRFKIVGNMVNDDKDMKIVQNLQKVVVQYLHIENMILGTMATSEDIRNSINRITPFVALSPDLPPSQEIKRMAARLAQRTAGMPI